MLTDAVRIRKYFLLHTSSIVIDRYSNFGNTYLSAKTERPQMTIMLFLKKSKNYLDLSIKRLLDDK